MQCYLVVVKLKLPEILITNGVYARDFYSFAGVLVAGRIAN